jgi:hypothetical protein
MRSMEPSIPRKPILSPIASNLAVSYSLGNLRYSGPNISITVTTNFCKHCVEVVLRHFHRSRSRAAHCGSFAGKTFNLLVVALGERGGHGDLRGSGRLSVIPYIHGKTELYCAQVYLV